MATVKITIETDDGTEIEVVERSRLRTNGVPDLSNVPDLLGVAARRAVNAVAAGGDRQNAITAVAERMGVVVDYVR